MGIFNKNIVFHLLNSHLHCTVPKEIHFPRYNMKCSRENVIQRGIFHVVSCFPLYLMLYCGNLDYFSDSVVALALHAGFSSLLKTLNIKFAIYKISSHLRRWH